MYTGDTQTRNGIADGIICTRRSHAAFKGLAGRRAGSIEPACADGVRGTPSGRASLETSASCRADAADDWARQRVFLRLAQAADITARDRAHFLALCAQVMRRILVDAARARLSAKRGGGMWCVQLDENFHTGELTPGDIARLDDALNALAQVDPRKSKAIELRFFGGLSVEETAEALGISRETALRDWRFARAWLKSEMNGAELDER
jgi:RNA polymerase sigma factor (TIGR02999 family)